MILALIVLIPFCIAALWAFFRFSPKETGSNKCTIFNSITIILAILVCALYSYRTYATMINTVDREWWSILSVLGSLFFFSIILVVAAVLRNFVFFRKRQ